MGIESKTKMILILIFFMTTKNVTCFDLNELEQLYDFLDMNSNEFQIDKRTSEANKFATPSITERSSHSTLDTFRELLARFQNRGSRPEDRRVLENMFLI